MARKKKKLTKAAKRKIAIRNLRKAWKANRKRKKSRRKNPRKRSKRKVRRKSKARKSRKARKSSKASRKRRNPRMSSVYSAGLCDSPWTRRFNPDDELDGLGINPGVVDSINEMGLDYAYTKPRRWNPEGASVGGAPAEEVVAVAKEVAVAEVAAPPCDCGTCPTHGALVSAARRLRRRNPGWSFKQGRALPHMGGGELGYQPRSRRRPRRWNPLNHMGGRMEGVYSAGACRRNPHLDPGGIYSIDAC